MDSVKSVTQGGPERRDSPITVEKYQIQPGITEVEIIRAPDTSEIMYMVREPEISQQQGIEIRKIRDLISSLIPDLVSSSAKNAPDMERMIQSFLRERFPWISGSVKKTYEYYLNRDFNGYGIIDPIVRDPNVEDISCNGPGVPVFVFHSVYGSLKTNINFSTEIDLSSYIIRMAQLCGKPVSISSPLLDGITRDGHRVEAIYSREVSDRGPAFTMRLFRKSPFTPTELIRTGTADPFMLSYLWLMVENLNSALIAGVPGSGKTSTLNSILMFAPENTKIFSIEETRELNISHRNWVPAETRELQGRNSNGIAAYGLFDLVKVAMRQRPTYIVVGEVRGKEAYALFQAMATGHTTYSTIHADSMNSLMNRLENEPMNVPKLMISYLNIVIFVNFVKQGDKRVRRITEISEIVGIDPGSGEFTYNRVFYYDPPSDSFVFTGNSVLFSKIADQKGIGFGDILEEARNRSRLLKDLAVQKADQESTADAINSYVRNGVIKDV